MEGDSSSIIPIFLGLIACIVAYVAFTISNASVLRSRSRRLAEEEYQGRFGVLAAKKILGNADQYLLTTQIGLYLSAFLCGALVVMLLSSERFWHVLKFLGDATHIYGVVLGTAGALILGFIAVVGVQVSKAIAYSHPENTLRIICLPLITAHVCLRPFVLVLDLVAGPLLTRLGLSEVEERQVAISAEEIGEIAEKSSEAGKLEEDESEMIQGVVKFSDTQVGEVMTPRKDIISVEHSATVNDAVKVFLEEGLSRLLVTGSELDDIRGILMAKDLMALVGKPSSGESIHQFVREAYTVPCVMHIDDLMQQFQKKALHFAVVLDEHGGVDGVVTLEDLVEEIVGEIFDEHDVPEDEIEVRETKSGDIMVDGSTPIDDLNEMYEFEFPIGEYDTIAGYVIDQLGRIPDVGDTIEHNGYSIRVETLRHNRVLKLRLREIAKAA